MDRNEWRPARWTPAQMEERRLAGAALLRRGRLTQAAIARRFGVSRASICRWAAIVRRRGRHGLQARPKIGRPPRLDARAWRRLGRLLARGAVAAGFETERWTLRRIAALIRREFGVRYHPRYLERPLKAHGFTAQRPTTRARERDERGIAAWPRREWVAIKKAGPPRGTHAALPRRDRPQLPSAAGHHLGAARRDTGAAAGEQAARGLQHRRGHP
jgi:transposase